MYSVSLPLPHRLLLAVFAITGAALTFFFGGNFPLAMGAMPILCAAILIFTGFLPRPTLQWSGFNWVLAGVFVPLVLVLVWALVQIMPLSAASHWAGPYWSLQNGTEAATAGAISFNPAGTLAQFSYAAGLLALAWGVFRIGQSHPRPLLVAIAVTITISAVYGIVVFALGNHSVLWLPKTSYAESLTSTFINRNSYATFAGLGILANLSLMLQRVGEISQRLTQRQRIKAFILLVLRPGLPWAIMALLCFVALVLTSSRAGLTASLCGILVMLGSLAGMRPAARWPLVGMVTVIVLVSFIILAAAGDSLGNRLNTVGDDANLRNRIYALGSDIIEQYPLTGTGFGTFADSFASVTTPELLATVHSKTVNAHNTYIELASELGYPAIALLGLSVFSLLVACLHGLRIRRRAIIWPALGTSTMVLVGVHALVDFSLSIPAVAFATISMVMLGLAQSLPLKEGQGPAKPHRLQPRYIIIPLAVVLIALSGWQTAANIYAAKASSTVARLEYGVRTTRPQLLKAQSQLQTCLAINPNHPTCGFSLAHVYLGFASGYSLTGDNRPVAMVFLAMAQQQYQSALAKSPANPTAWYRLARINSYMQEKPAAILALNNSLFTGPAEPGIAYLRVPFMLSLMPYLNADDTTLYTRNILRLWQTGGWTLGRIIQQDPSIHPAFAAIVQNEPNIAFNWSRMIKTPFPPAQPLGSASKNQ